jgi:hypothetical protein
LAPARAEGGDARQIKALLQAYVKEVRVVSRDAIYPSFYVPAVRQPSYSVERAGIEPATSSLQSWRSPS